MPLIKFLNIAMCFSQASMILLMAATCFPH
jgi:hypothetical protein